MDPTGDDAEPAGQTQTVQLDALTVVVALAGLTALAAFFAVVTAAPSACTLIVIALFFGMALDPVIVAWQRVTHWPRGAAAAAILLLAFTIFGAFFALAGPQLAEQSSGLDRELPDTVNSLSDLPLVGRTLANHEIPQKINDAVGRLPERMAGKTSDLSEVIRSLTFGAGTVLVGVVRLAGIVLEGPWLVRLARSAIPAANRQLSDEIGRLVYNVLAKYFAGNLFLATLHAIWVTATGLLAGIPLSPVLGVWVAITSLIPQIGGLLGFAVVFAVSLTQGIGPTIFMTLSFVAYMTFNNNVLLPLVVGKVVDVSAPVTMLAAIGGFSVAGVVGSLLAVPTIGALKAVTGYVRHRRDAGYEPPGSTPVQLDSRGWLRRLRHR